KTTLIPNKAGNGMIDPFWRRLSSLMAAANLPLLPSRSTAHQCPQRHQGSDGNVHVFHQLFLRERQRFHNDPCLILGLRVDQEDDASAVAARIPLSDFPVEVELDSCPNL